jgi:hypothetical protein
MRRWIVVGLLLLRPPPVAAQVDVVTAVKADLVQRGVALDGPCGAFAITRRVAWTLRHTSAGLLAKDGGNQCEGFAVDVLTYPDGSGIDVLGDAGDSNVPAWQLSEPPGALLGRWRAPSNPDDVVPVPPVPPSDLSQQILDELRAHEAAEQAFREAAGQEWAKVKAFVYRYVIPAALAFLGGKAL